MASASAFRTPLAATNPGTTPGGGGGAPRTPGLTIPPPPPLRTFRELFSTPVMDPYAGRCGPLMAAYTVGADFNASLNFETAVNAGGEMINAFAALVKDGSPAGVIWILHSPRAFPTFRGRTTPHDDKVVALVNDVWNGDSIMTVYLPEEYFLQSGPHRVWGSPRVGKTALEGLPTGSAVHPALQDGTTASVAVPYIMAVPPEWASSLLSTTWTPRQFALKVLDLAGPDATSYASHYKPIIHWAFVASTIQQDGAESSDLLLTDLSYPAQDQNLFRWTRRHINSMLETDSHTPSVYTQQATQAVLDMAGSVQDLLLEQRSNHTKNREAAAAASKPKTVSQFYRGRAFDQLLLLCDVTDEDQLPELWRQLAATGHKGSRESIQASVDEAGKALRKPLYAPIVTPSLAAKIASLSLAGANMDDLDEGVHPFAVVIANNTTSAGQTRYQEAVQMAATFDAMMQGAGAAALQDIQAAKSTGKVAIPNDFAETRAMLNGYEVLLSALLGQSHAVTAEFRNFLSQWESQELVLVGNLREEKAAPARLLRHVQLHIRAWLVEKSTAPNETASRAVRTPKLAKALRKLLVGDTSWLPKMPVRFAEGSAPKAGQANPAGGNNPTEPNPKAPPKQQLVRNPKVEDRFAQLDVRAKGKLSEVIKAKGDPPKVKRAGKDVNICLSYHLRGACYSNCGRSATHGTLSAEEGGLLEEWCKKAFE